MPNCSQRAVLAYPVDRECLCHLLHECNVAIALCVLVEALTHLRLPTLPLILWAIRVITVTVRKIAQNPGVLAASITI